MSLMEHLFELRRRLFLATLLGILLGTVVGFIWFGHGIPAIGLPSLSDILTGPYCAVPASERVHLRRGRRVQAAGHRAVLGAGACS